VFSRTLADGRFSTPVAFVQSIRRELTRRPDDSDLLDHMERQCDLGKSETGQPVKLDLTNKANEQRENCAVKVPLHLLGNSIFVKVVGRILGPSQETP
jgi:hypothetical protein